MSQEPSAAQHQTRALRDGNRTPLLGLGVWQIPDGEACVNAVLWALELGYRHIDTAQAYGNEAGVGEGLRRSGVPRAEVFITTKFDPWREDAAEELKGSLERLGMDSVDLYLVHCPRGGPTWAWPAMEHARESGLTKSIGVSNFNVSELRALVDTAVPPVVNQILFNPFDYRRQLIEEGERLGIVSEAYSPLGTGRHLSDPTVNRIAHNTGRTAAQVLLRWCLQRDLVVIPKSTHRERIAVNAQVFDFTLSDEEMAQLDSLDRTNGTDQAVENKWW